MQIGSGAGGTTKVTDSGASLSLVALGTNKVMAAASTSSSNGKTFTSLLDELYRLQGPSPSAALGNSNNLGLASEDAKEGLGDIWDMESLLADLDARKSTDESIPQ